MSDVAQTFRDEAADLLVQLEEALLSLEADQGDQELVNTAFRALHTIKGSGAMFGFSAAADFTHHVESAFDAVRNGALSVSSELIALGLAAKDHIRTLIEDPTQAAPHAGAAILDRLAVLVGEDQDGTPPAVPPTGTAPKPPCLPTTYRLRFALPRDALARGLNPLLMLDELRALGPCTVATITDAVPALSDLDPWDCHLSWDVLLTTDRPRAAIDEVFLFVLDEMDLKVEPVDEVETRIGAILVGRGEVRSEQVEAAVSGQTRLGDILVRDGALSEDKLHAALAEQEHVRATKAAAAAATIRVPAERMDGLMDQVGQLVIAQARLRQLVAPQDDSALKAVAEEIERLAGELRDTAMGIRMVPFGTLFGRFRRLVHDLSRDLGKQVSLSTSGEDAELDKTVMERLADPLVHIIRNSVDHGLESPEDRAAAGKPPQGLIHLAAHHSAAQVVITVRDDGRGLDAARIRARAEQAGLLPAGERISETELFQFIFRPGFSTAETVTSVSGRGVGMDVVRRTIESLRGDIDVDSVPGGGTTMTLRLPLTLAIIDGLLVRVGNGRYVIPLVAVEECVELSAADDIRSRGRNFLNIRGDLVPFLRLREVFASRVPAAPYQKVVVVSAGERRVGLVVDQVIGDHQTVIKSLSRLHADVETFSGGTILGDGTVALIMDIDHLVERGQKMERDRKAS